MLKSSDARSIRQAQMGPERNFLESIFIKLKKCIAIHLPCK